MITAADAEQLLQVVLPSLPSSVFKSSPGTVTAVCMTNSSFCAFGNISESKQGSYIC